MKLDEIIQALENDAPPEDWSFEAKALWYDAKGDWHRSHELCQEAGNPQGDRIHAYLHRKEGDVGNAGYWYNRAAEEPFEGTLEQEWTLLVERL